MTETEAAIADGDLVARAREGDVGAYAALIKRYQALAVGLAGVVMRNPAEADDVAQEAFLKAYYALHRFRPGASFRAWLVRIVVNEARNVAAAARRRSEVHARFREQASTPAMALSAENTALANEQRRALLEALDGLRDDDRTVLMLRYVFDLNEAEMAVALACSPGTVKSRLSRALSRLRGDLNRVAPLLAVSPSIGMLVGQALPGSAAPLPGASAQALSEAILRRIAAATPSGTSAFANAKLTMHQVAAALGGGAVVVALAVAGLWLSVSQRQVAPAPQRDATPLPGLTARAAAAESTPPATTASAPAATLASAPAPTAASTPTPSLFVVYGGELTDGQRQELSQPFGVAQQANTESISRDELVGTLQAAGLPTDGSERAISSAAVACLARGDGLRVRTQNITELPAAAYANALVAADVVDAAVVVAAPASSPMTGETALLGVLKAYPHCHAGQPSAPERLRLAYEQLRATAEMAQSNAAWDRAANVMLRGAQVALASPSPDAAALGAAVDEAATAEELVLDAQQRAGTIAVLSRLSRLGHGAYADGYTIQHVAADEARVVPSPPR